MKKYITQTIEMNYVSLVELLNTVKEYNLKIEDVRLHAAEGMYSDATIHFEYQRLETDEEYNKRLFNEKDLLNKIEEKEQLEYQRLKLKYGNNTNTLK